MWYYSRDNQQYGPVSLDALRTMVAAGQLGPDDFVRPESSSEWQSVRETLELASTATAAPLAYSSGGYVGDQPVAATRGALQALQGTRPWVRFLGILLFIGSALMVVGGLCGVIALSALPRRGRAEPPAAIFLLYPILGVVYLFPAIFLNQYASRITDLLRTHNDVDLEAALVAQRAFWRYVGILALVMLGLYVVLLIVLLGAGMLGASRRI